MAAGDKLRLYNGELLEIERIEVEYLDEVIKVYNFEVEDWHTYFVSDSEILVHNACKIYANIDGNATAIRNSQGVVTGGNNLSNPSRMMRGTDGNLDIIPKEIADNLKVEHLTTLMTSEVHFGRK